MKTRLQEVRKKAGFKSARAFAEHIGMPVATYTDYEQGRRSFTLEKALEFADALGCSLDELAGREVTPEMKRNSREVQALLDMRNALDKVIQDSGYENLGDGIDDASIDEPDYLDDDISAGAANSPEGRILDLMEEAAQEEMRRKGMA